MTFSTILDHLEIYHDFIQQFKILFYHPDLGLAIVNQGQIANINPLMAKMIGAPTAISLLGKEFESVTTEEMRLKMTCIPVGTNTTGHYFYLLASQDFPSGDYEALLLRLDHMLSSKQKPMLLATQTSFNKFDLLYYNEGAKRLLNIQNLTPELLESWVHPVDLERFNDFMCESLDHPSSRKNFIFRPENRPSLTLCFQAYPLVIGEVSHVLLIVEDPLLQDAIDAKNQQSQNQLHNYFIGSKDPMLVVDQQMRILEANLAFSQKFAYTEDYIYKKDFNDLLETSIIDKRPKPSLSDYKKQVHLKDLYDRIHDLSVQELPIFLEDAHIGKYLNFLPSQLQPSLTFRRLSQILHQIIPPQVLVMDPSLKVLWTSSANYIIGEFSTEGLIHQHLSHYIAKQSSQVLTQAHADVLSSRAHWFGGLWLEAPGEKQRLRHALLSSINTPQGEVKFLVMVLYPIQRDREINELIHTLSYLDPETNYQNAAALKQRLEDVVYESKAKSERFTLMKISLTPLANFPKDEEESFESLLLECVQEQFDIMLGGDASCYRTGHFAFTLIHRGVRLKKDGLRFIQAFIKDLTQRLEQFDLGRYVHCSYATCLFEEDGSNAEKLLLELDHRLSAYSAQYGLESLMDQRRVIERPKDGMIVEYLREGLPKGEFYIEFQPLIDLQTKKISGIETLLRWKNDAVGEVSPTEFIPLAEKSDLIVKLGYFVIGKTIRKLHQLRMRGHMLTCSVNISIRQLEQADFAEKIIEMMNDYELPGSSLEFEITEGITSSLHPAVSRNIHTLSTFGIPFNVDDFGTGYSSLKQMKSLNIKSLKIDRSLIEDMIENPNDQALIRAISAMAKSSGLRLIAEGVETPEQLAALEQIGFEEAQGFLFSMPLGDQDLERFIEDHQVIHG